MGIDNAAQVAGQRTPSNELLKKESRSEADEDSAYKVLEKLPQALEEDLFVTMLNKVFEAEVSTVANTRREMVCGSEFFKGELPVCIQQFRDSAKMFGEEGTDFWVVVSDPSNR